MKKEVVITIKGMQGDLLDDEKIEMMITGTQYEKNGKTYISYEDTYLDEDHATNTTIKISENIVSITRFGSTNTHMIFEKNKEHIMAYQTPYGTFEICSNTKDIKIDSKENKLDLVVTYSLEVNHMSMGITYFELNAKTKFH